MQDVVDFPTRLIANSRITNIGFDKPEAPPLFGRNGGFHFIQIPLMPGREVVQPDNDLVQFEQGLDQM